MSATHLFATIPGHPASVAATCPDGKVRTARPSGNGEPDTYFSIPAYVHAGRTTVAGYVTGDDKGTGYLFRPYVVYRSRDAERGARPARRGWDPVKAPDPERLHAVHLNNSLNPCGSHKDRHAKLLDGCIPPEALVRVTRHPALAELPFILETPNDDAGYAQEIAWLRAAQN